MGNNCSLNKFLIDYSYKCPGIQSSCGDVVCFSGVQIFFSTCWGICNICNSYFYKERRRKKRFEKVLMLKENSGQRQCKMRYPGRGCVGFFVLISAPRPPFGQGEVAAQTLLVSS